MTTTTIAHMNMQLVQLVVMLDNGLLLLYS